MFKRLLPWLKRKPIITDFLNSIANVMQALNIDFVFFTNDIAYKLQITNQKVYLEHYLNNIYDIWLRRIFIINLEQNEHTYLFTELENKPLFLPKFITVNSEVNSQFNYVVMIPTSVTYDLDQLKTYINKYNPVGKIYDIQTY
jgi:hypothetical protein